MHPILAAASFTAQPQTLSRSAVILVNCTAHATLLLYPGVRYTHQYVALDACFYRVLDFWLWRFSFFGNLDGNSWRGFLSEGPWTKGRIVQYIIWNENRCRGCLLIGWGCFLISRGCLLIAWGRWLIQKSDCSCWFARWFLHSLLLKT